MMIPKMISFFHLILETFKIGFENIKNLFSCGLSSGPVSSVKYLNFWWIANHNFLESKHPKDNENLYYVLFPEVSRKL